MFRDIYESLADIIQGWAESTQGIVLVVMVAITFFLYSRVMIAIKDETKKITNWGTMFIFLICFATLMLYLSCLQY